MAKYIPQNPVAISSHRTPVKRLSNKGKLAAQLIAIGYEIAEVAEWVGLTPDHLAVMVKSNLFKLEIEKARDKFVSAHAKDLETRLHANGPKAIETMVGLMDCGESPATQFNAAKWVAERVLPKTQESSGPRIQIIIGDGAVRQVEAVDAEYELIEGDSADGESDPAGGFGGGGG